MKLPNLVCCELLGWIAAFWMAGLPGIAEETAPVEVCLVGDSTVAGGTAPEPMRGWGQFLQPYFADSVVVMNEAKGGTSSKSFQTEGRWKEVLEEKPNYVLIQFGHNDALPTAPGTQPDGEYRTCLERYVDTARRNGSTAILVTPMRIRHFQEGALTDSLGPYAEAMRKVAARKKVALIDLYALTSQLFEKLGEKHCHELESVPGDEVHFNEMGARAIAAIVARELRRVEPRLAAKMLTLH